MQYLQLVAMLLAAITYAAGQPCRICGPESPDRSCYPQDAMTPPEGVAIQSSICSDIENNHKDYHNQLCEKYTKPNGYYFECTIPGTTNTFSCRSSCGPPLEDVGKGLNLDLLQGGGLFASLNQNRPQNRGAGLFDFANFNNDKGRGDTNFGNFATIGNFNLLANQNPAFGGSRGNFQNQGPISGGIGGGLPQQPAGPPPLSQVRPLGQLPPNPAKLPGHFPAQPLGEFPNFPQPTLNRGLPQGQNQGNAFPQQPNALQQQQNVGNTQNVPPSQANTFTPPQSDPQGPPGIEAPLEVIDFSTKDPVNVDGGEQSGAKQEPPQNPPPVQNLPSGASVQDYPNNLNLNNPDAQNLPGQINPNAAPVQNVPNAAPVQNVPNPASVQNVPGGASGPEYPSGGVPPQNNPSPVPGQNYQNGASPQNIAGAVSGQNLANLAQSQNYPGQPANQNKNPNVLPPQNFPNQPSAQNFPNQQAGQNYPNQPSNQPPVQNYPNQPPVQNYPNQPSGQNYPNQNAASQQSGQNFPDQALGQAYPSQPRPLANPQQNNLQPPLGGNPAQNYPEQPSVNSALPSVSLPQAENPQQPGPNLPPQQPPYPVDLSSDEVYPPGEGPNSDYQPPGRYTDASGPNANPGLSGNLGNPQGSTSQQDYPAQPQSPNPADPNAYPVDPQAPNNAGYTQEPGSPQDYAAGPQDGPGLDSRGDLGAGGSDQYLSDQGPPDYSGPRQPQGNQGSGSYDDPQAAADEFAASSDPQAAADQFAASSDPQGALDAYKSASNEDGSSAVELARQRETEDPTGSGSGGPEVSVGDERGSSSSDGRAPGLFDVPDKSPGSSSSSSSFSDPKAGHTDNLPPEAFRNPFKNPSSPFSKRTDQFESNPAFVGTSLIGEGFLDSPDTPAAPRPRGPDAVDIGGYALFPGFKDFEQTGVADALGMQKNNEQQNNIFSLFTSPTTTLPGQGRPSQGNLLGRPPGQVANGFSIFSPQPSPSTQTGGGGIFSPYFLSSPGRTDFLTPTQRRLSGPPYNQVPTNNAAVTGFPGQANNVPAPFPANPGFPNTGRSTQPNFRGPQPQSGTNPFLNAATRGAQNPGIANNPVFPNTGANNPAFQNPNPAPAGYANFRNNPGSFPANTGTAVFPPFGSTTSGQPGFAQPPSTNPGPDGFPPFGSTAPQRGSFPSRTGTSSGASGFPSTTSGGAPRASQTGRSDFGFGSTGNTDGFGFPGSFGSFNDNGFNNNNGFDKNVFSDELFNDKNAKQESSDETISTAPALTAPVPQSNSP